MSEDDKIESGMNTDAIATLIKLSTPPQRKEGEGICSPELSRAMRITKHKARAQLDSREDLLPVTMINYNGRHATIFLPKEDAERDYPDWIIRDSA